jgi:hypothetical protein
MVLVARLLLAFLFSRFPVKLCIVPKDSGMLNEVII